MKQGLMRPTAALFPAVLLVSALAGDRAAASSLFFYWCCVQLFSLCSVDAFRNAAAREPGVRRVDRRFSGTWPMLLLGMVLTGLIAWFTVGRQDAPALVLSAGLITIEQMFEERMFALSRRTDGNVLSVLSNVLLLAGMMLDAGGGVAAPVQVQGFFTACGAGLGMVISIIASYSIEPMHAFSLVPRNIAFFPKAAVQCLLYPAVMLLCGFGAAGYAGMMLWRLSRTVCRRAADESRPLNLLLVAAPAALLIAGVLLPGTFAAAFAVEAAGVFAASVICAAAAIAALVCALIVFCAPGWRVYTGAALVVGAAAAAIAGIARAEYISAALCIAAVVLNMHKAFLRKV